ncbi:MULTISPECIES: PEPxxWA-CTERM sorting domain-containing protein [unclassified Sphingobium]|uniref:PEPxxWA-CTERM sorting domain-containing protein n=1 Tax=unclassified Sphingobium TaxID=2611147 RepID=UPI0022259CE9|nr:MULTISPECIES: PEPxxWA-CTERM sorting domain-containing protein [unclassified Sphingobium]MCW2411204.1 hypothetical protein [Sphingobium sp. B8D3D]MCW2416504.1 hypothetical protein [Sphingobium sp. B8D3A]
MRKILIASLVTCATFAVQPAQAALVSSAASCSASDIGLTASSSFSCVGFYNGNLASQATTGDQTSALALLGLTLPNAFSSAVEKVSGSPWISTTTLNFDTMMYGTTYIGVHFGNIPNPSGKGQPLANNITAFYKFDAGTDGIDLLNLQFASGSNATIYKTGAAPVPAPVPEPATWALMVAGLGLAGMLMRRRAAKVQFA